MPEETADNWGWREVKLFFRFFTYSATSLGALVALWLSIGLPEVASKDYVNGKFKVATDNDKLVQSQLSAVRLQMNKLIRQSLEAEKYRLTVESKNNNSFDIEKRLRDINEELEDAKRERDFLLVPRISNNP